MCICLFLELTRQKNEGYIGYICVYVHVIGVTRQKDEGNIGCVCVYYMLKDWQDKEMRVTQDVYVSMYII